MNLTAAKRLNIEFFVPAFDLWLGDDMFVMVNRVKLPSKIYNVSNNIDNNKCTQVKLKNIEITLLSIFF
jgi:hypothetical protein